MNIKRLFLYVMFFSMTGGFINAQNELDVIRNNWLQYSDATNSLYHFLTDVGFEQLDKREARIAEITSIQELRERQAEVRKILWEIAGTFPSRTPLNARITGTLRKDGFNVENIIYESLPGFYVTASLFIPSGLRKPAPAILFCSGHSSGAYRLPFYQLPLLNLVRKGFIVLAIDPVGQGERLQYFDPEKGESSIGGSTLEHSYPSPQVFLLGKSVARYFIWDGIRGIDYLVSRKEVDPARIGVHGLSGGGTQTAYIAAFDDRVAASATAGFITSYRRLMESIGVQDGEQNFYNGLLNNIDHADYLEVLAPKPVLIMATTGDFFSIQGTRETHAEVKRIYEMLGKPENFEITEDDYGHGYTKKNREAMYAFFQKHLQLPGSPYEEDVEFVTALELQKTSTGQLSTSLGGETIFSLNRREAEGMINELKARRMAENYNIPAVLDSARKLSGYRKPSIIGEPVFTGRINREGYFIEKYFIRGEGNYVIPYLYLLPPGKTEKAVICLQPEGKAAVASPGGVGEWFIRNGISVIAPDLIGTGETGPGGFSGDAEIGGVSYNLWFTSVITGRSLAGIRAGDVVRLATLLRDKYGIREVYAIAEREMAPVLLHAAAFSRDIARIALIGPFSSYRSIVLNRFYNEEFVPAIVPGALRAYDIPDLEAGLAPRNLLLVNVTDGCGDRTDITDIETDIDMVRSAYRENNSDKKLMIVSCGSTEELLKYYREWLK